MFSTLTHIAKAVQHTEDGGTRTVAVILINVVAGAKMMRSETEQLLDAGENLGSTGVKSPVEILWRKWDGPVGEGGDTTEKGVEQGRSGGGGQSRDPRSKNNFPTCQKDIVDQHVITKVRRQKHTVGVNIEPNVFVCLWESLVVPSQEIKDGLGLRTFADAVTENDSGRAITEDGHTNP